MADNIELNLGSGGDTLRTTQDASGYHLQHGLSSNFQSASNTSTAALGSAATFTGTGEIAPADGVAVSCQTDNTGTLYFDFSVNGTDWAAFPSNGFAVASGIHEYHTAKVNGRYFRVRLVNDTGAQSYLRLYTYFGPHTQGSAPLNQALGSDQDATVVRPVDPMIDEALGRLGGTSLKDKFGYTQTLPNSIVIGTPSTWQDIWYYGGLRTSPTSSFTPYMASTSGSDTVDIKWTYQDASGVEQTVTVALNGQTPVSLGVTATEVYTGQVVDSTDLVGQVACTIANNFSSGAPVTQAQVVAALPAADNRTQVLAARIPAGKKAIMSQLELSMARDNGSAGSVQCVFQTRNTGEVWQTRRFYMITDSNTPTGNLAGMVLDPLTDYRVRIRDVSDSNTIVSGTLLYKLVDA